MAPMPSLAEASALISLGMAVGAFSGLLGIGGGLLIIPALSYLPSVLPLPPLSLHAITGVAITQSLAGGLASTWVHARKGNIRLALVLSLGGASMLGSYLGGYTSNLYSDTAIRWVFLCVLAGMLALTLRKQSAAKRVSPPADPAMLPKPPGWAWPLTGAIGYLSGILGIGGAAFMLPIMDGLMGIPLRLAIGSGAALVLLTSLTGFVGKWQAGQIPLAVAGYITLGALVGASLGARISHRLPEHVLRGLLFGLLSLSFLRTLLDLLTSPQ